MSTAKLARPHGGTGAAAATAPALSPPMMESRETAFIEAEPVPLTDLQIQTMANAAAFQAPTMEPPAVETAGVTASVWVTAKKVAALWVISQNRNSWASFQDAGWKRFADNSD